MKKMLKKAISVLLVAVMVFGAAPLAGFAGLELPEISFLATKAEAITECEICGEPFLCTEEGECGDNLTWSYCWCTGILTISGTGPMYVVGEYDLYGYSYQFRQLEPEKVIIENGVTYIAEHAFKGCDTITSVTISGSVEYIGDFAFAYCYKLEKVVLSEGLIKIGAGAFDSCYKMTSLLIPESVECIGAFAFHDCNIEDLTIPENVTEIGVAAFSCIDKLHTINYNAIDCETTLYYGNWGCYEYDENGKARYSSTHSPKNGTEIFKPAGGPVTYTITSINIGSNVKKIPQGLFCKVFELESLTLPESVVCIEKGAFYGCSNLKNIKLGKSVTSIADSAFSFCTSLTSMTIPDGVVYLGEKAFYNCTSLTSITIPNNITTIEKDTFALCSGLKSVTIGNRVTRINEEAFSRCTSLVSITIPKSLSEIENDVFAECEKIKDIYYMGSKYEWEQITIGIGNEALTSAKIHYSSAGNSSSDETLDVPDYDSSVVDETTVKTPTETTISYGDSIVLHVDPAKIPEGGYVKWYPSNSNFSYSVSTDGTTCTISPSKSGTTKFTALVYDAQGDVVSADEQEMTSKAGFFDKFVAFFKKLFGATKIIPQSYKTVY